MQGDLIGPLKSVIAPPPITPPVGSGHEKPMQYREEQDAFNGKTEPSFSNQAGDYGADIQLFPEALENQRWTQ
jgi:hypothetical protein